MCMIMKALSSMKIYVFLSHKSTTDKNLAWDKNNLNVTKYHTGVESCFVKYLNIRSSKLCIKMYIITCMVVVALDIDKHGKVHVNVFHVYANC